MASFVTSLYDLWGSRPAHMYQQLPVSPGHTTTSHARRKWNKLFKLLLCSLFLNAVVIIYAYVNATTPSTTVHAQCPAPLPSLLSANPPSPSHPLLVKASQTFEAALDTHYKGSDLDSVAIALVTSEQSVFEVFRGPLRANDTAGKYHNQVDRNSIYRIASISKLFTAFETLILREKGALNLDDPVSNFIPELRALKHPITVRQLMSHMSGIGRDWPPGQATDWPKSLYGSGPPPYNDQPFFTRAQFLAALTSNTMIADPYTFPVYSNTGYILLGYVNLMANARLKDGITSSTHADLIEHDIFQPLGLDGSSFFITDANRDRAVVSSVGPNETDIDFQETNPSGGQLSSLSDFVVLSKSLLNPMVADSLLPLKVLREWFRPIHTEWDGDTAIGMLWEIYKTQDSFGQSIDVYQKQGDLLSHHTAYSLLPARSFAVAVLTTGPTSHSYNLTNLAISHFRPAFDQILVEKTQEEIGGQWMSSDGNTKLFLEIQKGSLHATRYIINGTDALATLQGGSIDKMAVWYIGNNEYRLSPSRGLHNYGCFAQWVGLDDFAYSHGAPVNLLRLIKSDTGTVASNILQIPSIQLNLTRRYIS